jgi:hypothetical protein
MHISSSPRSLLFCSPSFATLYFMLYLLRSPYCSSCLLPLLNELLVYLLALFPSSLMRLCPSSVHLTITQKVFRFSNQHLCFISCRFRVRNREFCLNSIVLVPSPFCGMSKSNLWIGHNHFCTIVRAYSLSHFGHNLCNIESVVTYSHKPNVFRKNTNTHKPSKRLSFGRPLVLPTN